MLTVWLHATTSREETVADKIFVTKPIFPEALEFLRSQFVVEINEEERVLSKEELIAQLQRVRGAMTQLTDIMSPEVLEAIPDVRIVSNIAVGYNNIDVDAASRLGIL